MAAPKGGKCEEVEPELDRNSWFLEHPKMVEMQDWNFDNGVQIQATLLVYLDLCEAKNWWNVQIHPCDKLCMGYITGKATKKSNYQTVLPITTQTCISMERLQEYLKHIPTAPNQNADPTQNLITLAITDSDSTTLYYRIANGLLSPEIETEMEEKIKKRKRKRNKGGVDEQEATLEAVEEKVDPFAEVEL